MRHFNVHQVLRLSEEVEGKLRAGGGTGELGIGFGGDYQL